MKSIADRAKGLNLINKVREAGDITGARTFRVKARVMSALPGELIRDQSDLKNVIGYSTYLKRPDLTRVEQRFNDQDGRPVRLVIINRNGSTYVHRSDKPEVKRFEKPGGAGDEALFAPGTGMGVPGGGGSEEDFSFLKDEELDGYPCHVIEEMEGNLVVSRMWVHRENYSVIQMEYPVSGGTVRVKNHNLKKEPVGGWMPRKVETYHDGNLMSVMEIEELQVNPSLEDSLFDPDKLGN